MRRPARLRPDAARPRLRQLRGHRGALRAAAQRLGRADGRLGPGPRRAAAVPHARRDPRQHRRLLGARAAARAGRAAGRGLRRCAGRATSSRRPPGRLGRADAHAAAATTRRRARGARCSTSSTSRARRCTRCRPMPPSDAGSQRQRQRPRRSRATPTAIRPPRRLAHDAARSRPRSPRSRWSCAPSFGTAPTSLSETWTNVTRHRSETTTSRRTNRPRSLRRAPRRRCAAARMVPRPWARLRRGAAPLAGAAVRRRCSACSRARRAAPRRRGPWQRRPTAAALLLALVIWQRRGRDRAARAARSPTTSNALLAVRPDRRCLRCCSPGWRPASSPR